MKSSHAWSILIFLWLVVGALAFFWTKDANLQLGRFELPAIITSLIFWALVTGWMIKRHEKSRPHTPIRRTEFIDIGDSK